MPNGLQVKIPSAFTDTTLPILREDLVIPTTIATGVLALLEMNHSFSPAGSGVASGLMIPNIAWQEAAALIGSGTLSTLSSTLGYDPSYVSGTTGLFERTSKGALHGMVSQTNNTASSQGAYFRLADPIRQYILANSGHSYFMSLWDRITRVAVSGATAVGLASLQNNASGASNRLINVTATSPGYVGGTLGVQLSQAFNTVGNAYYEVAQAGYSGSVPSFGSDIAGVFWGTTTAAGAGQNSAAGNFNKLPSHIFYRLYLEDITVSGRTFAQVSALDQQAFALAFGAGGRYAGDTFTTPTL